MPRMRVSAPNPKATGTFDALSATPWARRARQADIAAGGRPAAPAHPLLASLTPGELRVVLPAARGATNRQIADAQFISPRTVEAHLAAAFRKLGVSNRTELASLVHHSTQP